MYTLPQAFSTITPRRARSVCTSRGTRVDFESGWVRIMFTPRSSPARHTARDSSGFIWPVASQAEKLFTTSNIS